MAATPLLSSVMVRYRGSWTTAIPQSCWVSGPCFLRAQHA